MAMNEICNCNVCKDIKRHYDEQIEQLALQTPSVTYA